MAVITYDGQSFLIDGRRIWLVSGTVEYARVARELWSDRIAKAKNAGLNTITTSVVWSRHESRAGQFDFTGQNDIRHFIEIIRDAGMHCVLRLGPFIGNGYDLGGLPAWLLLQNGMNLRTSSGPFLESCSRFISAVAKQVRELQATAGDGDAGPIVLIQNENAWTCGHEVLARGYLGELGRYIRESGFEVPLVNANDLWQGVEGEIDGWTGEVGSGSMLANLRQLGAVRPTQPRLVVSLRPGKPTHWGSPKAESVDPDALQRTLAEILAAGGQFNLDPFAGGTNVDYLAGRLPIAPDAFLTTGDERGSVLSESGKTGESYHAVRRVAMFASRFSRLLSHLETKRPIVSLVPPASEDEADESTRPTGHVVVHASGSQGSVAFVFAPKGKHDGRPAQLLLPDGSTLPVHLGEQPVAWCALDTRLMGRSQLDYCNLSVIAMAGRVLVASGPAGSPARLSINGADVQAHVPEDDGEPLILDHEGVLVMIISDAMLPSLHISESAVYMGVDGLTLSGEPIVSAWGVKFRKIDGEGSRIITAEERPKAPLVEVKKTPVVPARSKAKPSKLKKGKGGKKALPEPEPVIVAPLPPPPSAVVVVPLKTTVRVTPGEWASAMLDDYVDGTGPRFASIPGPADLNVMGAPYGYGWYRLKLKNSAPRKAHLAAPQGADRLAIFAGGEPVATLGVGPGAEAEAVVHLDKGEQTLVILAENMGRFSGGPNLGEHKGLFGHLYEVENARVGKGVLKRGEPIDVLESRPHYEPPPEQPPDPRPLRPLWYIHEGDTTDPMRITWNLAHKKKSPLMVSLRPGKHRGLVLLNDKVVRFFDPSGPATIFLDDAVLSRGNNTLQLAIVGDAEAAMDDLIDAVEVRECIENLTAKAEWAFAKWERPSAGAFGRESKRVKGPRWWRMMFTVSNTDRPLAFDTEGLSKGQVWVNGRHLGRYFSRTGDGKVVGPQTRTLIPSPLLMKGRDNEIVVFDEHGASPAKSKLGGE